MRMGSKVKALGLYTEKQKAFKPIWIHSKFNGSSKNCINFRENGINYRNSRIRIKGNFIKSKDSQITTMFKLCN